MPLTAPQTDAAVDHLLADARQVIAAEATALTQLAERLAPAIGQAMQLIYARTGGERNGSAAGGANAGAGGGGVVVSGIGKSGLTGQRISASFSSTGTPSHFLHPVEAVHGDLGRVRRDDVMLLLSNSGGSDELIRLADVLKRMAVPMILITGQAGSPLGKIADICISMGDIEEACPLRLAPTTSLAAMSALGDALVLGVMSLRKFSREDFALFHPAGNLGRKLLKVGQAMGFRVPETCDVVPDTCTVQAALEREKAIGRRPGAIVLVNDAGTLSGIFTDGDLRRQLGRPGLLNTPISQVMTTNPKRIAEDALASEAMAIMNSHRIDELPVVDAANRPVGIVDVQDLLRLRMIE